jgi:hypothetical protein
MYDTISTRSPLSKKAGKVGTIFDTIGWIVLIVGGLAVVVTGLVALATMGSDNGSGASVLSLIAPIVAAIYTAVLWASVSLATIVAQYIASKS